MDAAPTSSRLLPLSPPAMLPVLAFCAGLGALGALASGNATGTDLQVLVLAVSLVPPLGAAVLLDARPWHPAGLLLTVPGVLPVVTLLVAAGAEGEKPSAARAVLEAPHLAVVGAAIALVGLPLVVPHGWPTDRWGKGLGLAAAGIAATGAGAYLLRSDRQAELIDRGLGQVEQLALWALVPLALLALARLVEVWRSGTGPDRHRAAWLLVGLLVCAPATTALAVADGASWTYLALGLAGAAPVALVWLLLTPSVPSVDRALLRVALAAGVVGGLAGAYATARWLLGRTDLPDPGAAAAVTTGLVGAVLLPAYVRARDAALVRLYGTARPGTAMGRLGRTLEAADELADALAAAAASVAAAVRSPSATLHLGEEPAVPDDGTCALPLVAGQQQLGILLVAPRRAGEPFSRRDLELLQLLSTPVAQLARAAVLARELERARGDVVAQRLDERRRLRRDLHDSVGPLLAGLGLHADAARRQHPDDERLQRVTAAVQACRQEVRRLVDALEPDDVPVQDLEQAVRDLVEGWASATVESGLHLVLEVPGPLPELPEQVRLAAYRVVGEALTNVVRHADARHASVRLLTEGGDLVVEVRDDGRGTERPADEQRQGVGLRSMAARAVELGGELELSGAPDRGTSVRARFPL